MNTLGKTVVALGVSIVIILTLVLTRDFGAPRGYRGDGFGTMQEALEDGIGASYTIAEEIDAIEFDDGVIYLVKTKDDHVILSYLFRNRQKTKFYLEAFSIESDFEGTEWCSSKNKVKTNYKVTDSNTVIKECDNQPVTCKEYTVVLHNLDVPFRLYYNRIDKK